MHRMQGLMAEQQQLLCLQRTYSGCSLYSYLISVFCSCRMPNKMQLLFHDYMTCASLCCRAHAGQGPRVFYFDQVVNEDAGQDFTYHYTAHSLVKRVRKEGGAGCFITLGLPRSGKTYMMEVSMCAHLPSATSAGSKEC